MGAHENQTMMPVTASKKEEKKNGLRDVLHWLQTTPLPSQSVPLQQWAFKSSSPLLHLADTIN